MKKSCRLAGLLTAIALVYSLPAKGDTIPSWEITDPSALTLFWQYNFNDGILPPTITGKGGFSTVPTDPVWTMSGSGDFLSIVGGKLGIHDASQPSQLDLRLDIPNGYDAANIKFFWFAYDYGGTAPIITGGTDNAGHTVSEITYTDNTVDNHIEGYITIDPQPQDEWLNLHLTAGTGETVWIDNLQVGSTCIPEPSSMILAALGGVVIFRTRKGLRRGSAPSDGNNTFDWKHFFTSTANY